jgi:hypothetical protein
MMAKDITKQQWDKGNKKDKSKGILHRNISQAFPMMHNPRRQARHLIIKNRYLLCQTTSFASFAHSHLCLAFGQSQASLKIRNP